MQDEHRPCAFADDEVALPMAGFAAAFNGLRTIMDRRSILDGVARGSGATRATAFVATRQITPQGRGLLCGPIDEGVQDCLAADGPQPRFIPGFQPTGDLFGRPSLGETGPHEQTVRRPLVRGSLHAASGAIDRLRRRGSGELPAQRECVPLQLPGDGGFRPTERPGNGAHRPPRSPQNADLVSFVLRQMRIGSHGNTP